VRTFQSSAAKWRIALVSNFMAGCVRKLAAIAVLLLNQM
jgi:hypothetical protein